jgi:SAM-dependent methyltransferase
MATWSDGYFTDIAYTSRCYPEMAPGFMSFACLRQGVRPPALGPGAAYLELGCGQGYGLNLLAAANPGMVFHGVDFHPGQVDNARRLAGSAGLSNISFADLSFEQVLALPEGRLPKFEVIALHGVWSWISPENRAVIVQLLDRLLAPGGMVYVSYNCLPGWAPLAPLQRFVADHVRRQPGDPRTRVVEALKAALAMADGQAGFFLNAPLLKPRIEESLKLDPVYLVHEFLNDHSHPFFHADVARELDGARLAFAASASLGDDFVNLTAPLPLQARISEEPDQTWRETLLDYASGKPFRRDIFVRGRNMLSPAEREERLNATRFALLIPPGSAPFEFPVQLGRVTGRPQVYQPIVEALAQGPRSYGELLRLAPLAQAGDAALLQAIALLVGGRHIHPLAPQGGGPGPAAAFNRAVLGQLAYAEAPKHLAAAAVGTAVRVELTDLLALKAMVDGEADAAKAARTGWEIMARTNQRLMKNGEVLVDQAANEAELAACIQAFHATKAALLQGLGVI